MLDRVLAKIALHYKVYRNYIELKNKYPGNLTAGHCVFFDLQDFRHGAYYYPIIFSFHERGYTICLADRYKFIGNAFGPSSLIYKLERIQIRSRKPSGCNLMITDSYEVYKKHRKNVNCILLNSRVPKITQDRIILPYPMHPNAYHSRYFENIHNFQKQKRTVKFLFSGNIEDNAYSNPIISERYSKINRVDMIRMLTELLPSPNCLTIRSERDLVKIPKTYFNGALLYLWKWSPEYSEGLAIRVPNEQWLPFLSTGDFFLCCPGIVIPQSHNAIEAMSVGTIPILQYSEFFHPGLKNLDNCISFESADDFKLKIDLVLKMSPGEIIRLRRNVITYYETYLKNDYVAAMIIKESSSSPEIFFYNEVVD